MFKKILVALLVFVSMCGITGCIPVITDEYYEISQETENIESIALYACDNTGDELNKLDEIPLASVQRDDFAAFVNELEGIYAKTGFYITIAAQDPSFCFGKYVVKITYQNGDQEFVSNGGYQELLTADGTGKGMHYSFDKTQWDALLQKYFFSEVIY